MESLIGYASEDEAGECNEDNKDCGRRSCGQMEMDDNYDNVQMDMSEDSDMVHSSDTSLSDASSERRDQSSSSDEERKPDRKPVEERHEREEKKEKRLELRDTQDKRSQRQDQPKEKSENWSNRPLERKGKNEDRSERSAERKQRPDAKREIPDSREIKSDDQKRKSEDVKRYDDRKETKPRRDDASRSKEERSRERCSKDQDSKLHRDSRERGIDDRRPKSREKYGKEGRRGDGHKEDRKTEERRTTEWKEERKPDDRHGEERKQSKERVRRDVTAKRDRSRSPRRFGEEKGKSPSSHHRSNSRSPFVTDKKSVGEKRGASPRHGNYNKRSKHSPERRRRSRSKDKHSPDSRRRSRSRERSMGRPRQYEKKPSKLSILERLGIALPTVSDVSGLVTPQELVQRSMQVQVQQVKSKTGIELPSYYNPAAMNPARYAEQIQKRRLLWGNKGTEPAAKKVPETVAPAQAQAHAQGNNWEGTTFAADQDGKMTAKFKRLMGIKNQGASSSCDGSSDGSKPEIIKKQEELFSSMEMQYEVARVATHTHRGLGLGFGTFQYPR